VGFFGYDLRDHVERVPRRTTADLSVPDLLLGLYDAVVAFDHDRNEAFLCSTGYPERDPSASRRWAKQRLQWLRNLFGSFDLPPSGWSDRLVGLSANFARDDYLRAVGRVQKYIADGDIYQVNLSQRFATPFNSNTLPLYLRLREASPAPFAAYLRFDDVTVLSSSPERFLRISGRRVQTRPIKGTRPRGGTPDQDRQLARDLWNSAKDRAELVMIVDLERPGSGLRLRQRARNRAHGAGSASHGLPPCVHHRRSAAPGSKPRRLPACLLPRRLHHRRPQDPRHADHRGARAVPPRSIYRRDRLPGVERTG
jgi:para-aminobenzoate synthetase component I